MNHHCTGLLGSSAIARVEAGLLSRVLEKLWQEFPVAVAVDGPLLVKQGITNETSQ